MTRKHYEVFAGIIQNQLERADSCEQGDASAIKSTAEQIARDFAHVVALDQYV